MRNKLDIRIKAEEFKKKLNITNGIDGKDGKDGKKGKDGIDGKDGKKGLKGDQGDQGEQGIQGIDGSPDTPYDIKIKLESLTGEYRLDAFAIKNLPEWGGMAYNERRITRWGTIQGTLSDQTDLQAALDDKWSKLGDAGTVDGTNFIGTTDDVAFNIRVNNQKAGRIDSVGSLFLGYQAGNVAVYATTQNTGIGFQSLVVNTTGDFNVALGYKTLSTNITGSYNTAVGYEALLANTNDYNTAFGYRALYAVVGGSQNTGLGYQAGNAITSGNYNVAIGTNSLLVNTAAHANIAIGVNTLVLSTSGFGNIAIGYQAADNQTFGVRNTVIGYDADVPVNNDDYQLNICNLIFGTGASGTGVTPAGNMGVAVLAPTARLHLPAGTATASTAPLKFTSGISLTTAEAGAVEMTTDDLFFTITTGAARKNITLWDTLGTTGRVPYATTNGRLIDSANMTFNGTTLTVSAISSSSITLPTFTLGSVLFAGTGGIITEDNANFFWDDTNDRLGIGTATPSYSIHIRKTDDVGTNLPRLVIENLANNTAGIHIIHDTSGTQQVASIGYSLSSDILRINNAGSFTSSHLIIDTNGFIGIGMINPQNILDILGTVTTDQINLRSARAAIVSTNIIGGISFTSDDTSLTAPGTIVSQFRAIASATHTATVLDTDFVWNTTKGTTLAEVMRLWSNGRLDIKVQALTGAETLLKVNLSDDVNSHFGVTNATGGAGVFIPWFSGTQSGASTALIIGGNITTDTGANAAVIFDVRNVAGSAIATRPLFVWRNYTTEEMRMDAGGRLGIGVTTLTAMLHIKAGTTAASSAPLKFTSGTSMTAAEAGAVEFTTDDLFFTITTGAARKRLLMADPVGGLTSTRVPFATTNGRLTDSSGMTYATATSRLSPTYITLGGGSTTQAPLKLTLGVNLTTPESGAFEFNGDQLFFTRDDVTRNEVMMSPAQNIVSPTSPNRTINIIIGGVTYYIHAKTTND